jgi:hypothetical protein
MTTIHDRLTTRPSRQLTAPLLRRIIWFAVLLNWTPFLAVPAYAAALGNVSALEAPLNVPPVLLGLVIVISTLAGATSLAMRIDRELSAAPDMPLLRPWVMATSHMLGAWLAGVAAFIGTRRVDLDVWETLGTVLAASFLSAKALELMLERWSPSRITSPPGSHEPQP